MEKVRSIKLVERRASSPVNPHLRNPGLGYPPLQELSRGRARHRREAASPRLYRRFELMTMTNSEVRSEVRSIEQSTDEQRILALHEAGDRALMSADLTALAEIFADDYVQYNESGQAFAKQDVLDNFRTGAIRYPSIISTGRRIRVFGDTAVVHGSESDEVEAG